MATKVSDIDQDTARAVRMFLQRIAGDYDYSAAYLYGSRARKTHRPDSDADVAVVLKGKPKPLLPTAFAMADVEFDVLLETGVLVSSLPIWEEQWKHPETFSNPWLLKNIADEGIRL